MTSDATGTSHISRIRHVDDLESHPNQGYPAHFKARLGGLTRKKLGQPFGLEQFGVNLATIPPGGQSSLRHWHTHEDELVYVLEGEVVLVTDAGEELMRAGDVAGFRAGSRDGHHLLNRSSAPARVLEVGARHDADVARYADDDLAWLILEDEWSAARKDGTKW